MKKMSKSKITLKLIENDENTQHICYNIKTKGRIDECIYMLVGALSDITYWEGLNEKDIIEEYKRDMEENRKTCKKQK